MKYALISDVHGNLLALEAVLADAKAQGTDQYLLLGDYINDLPWPNEVTETIRSIENAVIIRGNKEDYLTDISAIPDTEQFAPVRWNDRTLTKENKEYLLSLPQTATLETPGGAQIRLVHNSPIFFRTPKISPLHSGFYYEKMIAAPFTHAAYLDFSTRAVLENDAVMTDLSVLSENVYAFGHNHLQWHMKVDGKYIINPGSCGVPLDFGHQASYTLLEETAEGRQVEERRVAYDVTYTIQALASSSLFQCAEIWSRIIMEDLRTGRDYIGLFLTHVKNLAQLQGEPANPVSNAFWREAAHSFPLFDVFHM